MFLFSCHSRSVDFFRAKRLALLNTGNPLENPNRAGLAVSEGPDPLANFKDKPEKIDSEKSLQDFEKALSEKENVLTKRYEKYPQYVEKVHAFFREQREELERVHEKLSALQAQYEGKRQELGKPVSDLLKPFIDTTMESTTTLEKGIDGSIEDLHQSIADAIASAAEEVSKNPTLAESGVCEQYSDAVKKLAMKKLPGNSKELVLNWQEPLADGPTNALRGTLVSALTPESLNAAGVQPGMVFYVANAGQYNLKMSGVIPKINETDRHWFTALDNGLFADNLGTKPRSLKEIQGSVGDRTVLNIHDPYQSIRGVAA
ncbi:MAG: hypothetical protein AAB551_03335 [Patescibacteria group bacterium]